MVARPLVEEEEEEELGGLRMPFCWTRALALGREGERILLAEYQDLDFTKPD